MQIFHGGKNLEKANVFIAFCFHEIDQFDANKVLADQSIIVSNHDRFGPKEIMILLL